MLPKRQSLRHSPDPALAAPAGYKSAPQPWYSEPAVEGSAATAAAEEEEEEEDSDWGPG